MKRFVIAVVIMATATLAAAGGPLWAHPGEG